MTEFISTVVQQEALALALVNPPSWTRLEPQTTSGDPRPGLEARVHDPLWLLCRQWQLGEFEGEDAGSPLTVRVVTRTRPVDRWAPRDVDVARPLGPRDLLEPAVEAEAATAGTGPGLRPRAEAGMALLAALGDSGAADVVTLREELVAQCPLDLDPANHPGGLAAALDPAWVRLTRLLAGRPVPDGESAAAALEAAAPDLPPWLTPADASEVADVLAVATEWLAWYRAEVSPLPADDTDAWVGDRLEYRFRVGAGPVTLEAPQHGGGEIGWPSFRAAAADLPLPDGAPDPGDATAEVHALLASPLRYPGMPADRLWEFEDAQVNLGVVEAEPWDLARLLLAEFALAYGNDWLVVPVDVPIGSLTTVESVLYVTTFGERYVVRPTTEVSPDGQWRMFALSAGAVGSGDTVDGLLVPPGALAVHDGPAVEEVLFLRDEMANLAWAVERTVQGPSGLGRDRSRERDGFTSREPGPVVRADLDYLLQTSVPARWIPYLPRTSGYRAIELVQGAMPDADGAPVLPLGQLLTNAETTVIKDAEIPREGMLVRRQPSVTRRVDGQYVRWTTRRARVGRGEGASNLAFDTARNRTSPPNSG